MKMKSGVGGEDMLGARDEVALWEVTHGYQRADRWWACVGGEERRLPVYKSVRRA